jgi:hypothetical protein
MHNTVAFDVVMLVVGALVITLMAWVLLDGLRRGRLPLKYGPDVVRRRQPIGYWMAAALMTIILVLTTFGYGTLVVDLIVR